MLKTIMTFVGRKYREYIPNLAVLFLFPISCWSTYSGIRELMRSTGLLSNLEGLFVSIGLTMGIQITLLYAISSVLRVPPRRRPLYVIIYALTVFFSVLFGYAFYFRHLRADDFAREVHQQETQRLLLRAETYRAKFHGLARSLKELSSFSAAQSEQEDRLGGTCGDYSPQGRGPRAKGRRTDAEIFGRYNGDFQSLVDDLDAQVQNLRTDVAGYSPDTISRHHSVLEVFYQRLSGQRIEAEELLKETRGYIQLRFPDGRYTIRDGDRVFLCPDDTLEHLVANVLQQQIPDLPAVPQKFEAGDPKTVVHYAMEKMTGYTAGALRWFGGLWGGTGANAPASLAVEAGRTEAKDNLPLYLGLLVDCLIFLAAMARRSDGRREESSLQRLGGLGDLPVYVHDSLRRQLARLLGCSPSASLFAAYNLLKRYETRMNARAGIASRVFSRAAVTYVAVPKTGEFHERLPEVHRLEDLIRLLEALKLARCIIPDLRWADLAPPLPAGLAGPEIERNGKMQGEYLELYKLDARLMGDLVQEVFVADELPVGGSVSCVGGAPASA